MHWISLAAACSLPVPEYVLDVAEDSHSTPQAAEKEPAAQRREQGLAVAALNAFSSPDFREDARRDHRFHEPREALETLAAAIFDEDLRIPRLFVLDALVKLANRRGERLDDHDNELNALLMALAERAGPSDEAESDVRERAATVRGALDTVSRLGRAAAPRQRWRVFAEQAADALRLTETERDKPVCNDDENVRKGSREAVAVTVEFHTDAAPGELRHFCDPTRWHEFSAYQLPMQPWRESISVQKPNGTGWRQDLLETVKFSPALTLRTPLRFTYTIDGDADPRWVHLDYVLREETEDIVVDEGALDVRRMDTGKHVGRTRVSAKKAILFRDPVLSDWTTIACDTFWTDMVIATAVASSDGGGTQPNRGRTQDVREPAR